MARGVSVSMRGLCVGVLVMAASHAARADVLAGWNFEGVSASTTTRVPGTTDARVVVGNLTLGAGINPTGATDGFGGSEFRDGTSDSPSYDEAVADQEYVTFTITAAAGYTLSLSGFDPYNVRHNVNGPAQGTWEYALDGATFNFITGVSFGSVTGNSGNVMPAVDLSGIAALQNLPDTTTVTFRLVIYDAVNINGDWYFNGHNPGGGQSETAIRTFVVNGTLTPEPAGAALLALGGVFALAVRRRR